MSKRGSFNFPTSGTSFNEARVGVRGNDPDFLYYNAQIINNSTLTTSKTYDPEIRYQDTRAVAILQDKSNYAVSVENFTINGAGKNLPIFIPQIREYNSDGSVNRNPNNTIYDVTFTVQYGGTKENPTFIYQSTRSVQWEPENKAVWNSQPSPLGVYQYPQPEIPYYYCYTYSHWVKLVNKALALAWGDVMSAAKNGGVPGLTIIINSLSGSKCDIINQTGTFVVGARIRSIGTGVESIAEITSLSPFVINVLSGNFDNGTEIEQSADIDGQIPNVDLATAIIETITPSTFNVGQQVECVNPATGAQVGTGIVVSYSGNTVVIYNIVGDFLPGYLLNQEPDVGTASITTTSIYEETTVPEILLGTKCPFYTYDPKTNLFSLWQDSNTCVVPFGSSVPSPSPLSGFGASTASGYIPGEYSFIGYNTNFESLFTNFNSTYYSDQVPYGVGASIQSPIGTESISQATVVNTDGAQIVSFPDGTNQMTVQWSGTPISVAGSNWTFASPLVSTSTRTLVQGNSYSFAIPNIVASYVQLGFVFEVTASNGNSAVGYVTNVSRTPPEITSITLQILSTSATPCTGSDWKFTLPIDSTTYAEPTAGVPISLQTNLFPNQTPLVAGYVVQVTGAQGQEFTGTISSFTETVGYTGGSGVADQFVTYDNATLPNGFNPVASFQAQSGKFVQGDTVQGKTSKATGKVIEVTSGNLGTDNTLEIIKQSGPFTVGDTWITPDATGKIINIDGPNSATQTIRTGIVTIGESYINPSDNKTYYSGPFATGDTIQAYNAAGDAIPGSNAVITAIEGDNGYTKLTFSQQKNPFVIGHVLECYASLSDTDPSVLLCSGTVVDIIGDNTGYGTVNVGNQNGQFGIGEVIVNDTDNSVATIVGIQGTNTGYGTIAYINQITTGAPGSFIPGEFLLFPDTLQAFAKVIIDKQNVINQTEGNIGNVTVITGVEHNGIFTPTSNVALPGSGSQIIGAESGTNADYGGIVYQESAVLTVNNIAGSFNIGDKIVDNVGFGLANTAETISVTATCNGFSYLGNGQLVLKNISGGIGTPQHMSTSNFIIDYQSKSPPTVTNTTAINVVNITPDRQFINGDQVQGQSSGAKGTVITNCGSFPYPGGDPTSQLLTILPDVSNTEFFQEGEILADTRPATTLSGLSNYTGPFITGDLVTSPGFSVGLNGAYDIPHSDSTILVLESAQIIAVGTAISSAATTTLSGSPSSQTGIEFNLVNSTNIPLGTVVTGKGLYATLTNAVPETEFTLVGLPTVPIVVPTTVYAMLSDVVSDLPATVSSNSITFTFSSDTTIPVGTTVTGNTGSPTAIIRYATSPTTIIADTITGSFASTDTLTWSDGSATYTSQTVGLNYGLELVDNTGIPIGTTLQDVTGSVLGLVINVTGSSPFTYTVKQITNIFTVSESVYWKSDTSAVVSYYNDLTLVVDTVVGVFPSSGILGYGANYLVEYSSASSNVKFTFENPVFINVGTIVTGETSGAQAIILEGSIDQLTYTAALDSGTFDPTEVLRWLNASNATATIIYGSNNYYLADNITGEFETSEILTWSDEGSAQYFSQVPDPQLVLTLTNSETITPDTTIYGQSSGTSAVVIAGSGTSYIVDSADGTFTSGEAITWGPKTTTGVIRSGLNGSNTGGTVVLSDVQISMGTIYFTFDGSPDIPLAEGSYDGTTILGLTSGATALITAQGISLSIFTGPNINVSGTFLQNETVVWGYVVNNVVGAFQPTATISWASGSGNVYVSTPVNTSGSAYAQFVGGYLVNNTFVNTILFTSPTYIPLGTQITGSPSNASGIIISTNSDNTNYYVQLAFTPAGLSTGNFAQYDLISWTSHGGASSVPTSIILTNVTGIFPTIGPITIRNPRKLISVSGRSNGLSTGGGYHSGVWCSPTPFGQIYNWNTGATITCMGFVNQQFNVSTNNPHFNTLTAIFDQSSLGDGTLNYLDKMGQLPFITYDNDAKPTILPSGMNITLSNNTLGFKIGSYICFFNGASQYENFGGTVISINGPASNGTYNLNVACSSGYDSNAGTAGCKAGNNVGTGHPDTGLCHINEINYFTYGFEIYGSPTYNLTASASYNSAVPFNDTEGVIASINISASSAFVQTFKPPANTTSLTLTNLDGSLIPPSTGIAVTVKDETTGNFGGIQDFNETTNYTQEATTLTISNVVGSVVSGAIVTDSGNSNTATINAVSLSNGGFIFQPILGSLVNNEELLDLGSFATATYTGKTDQTVTGLTSDATATIIIDSGSQLKLDNIVGNFILEPIQSSLGVQADIIGFPLFGVGNTIIDTTSGATGIIVSDTGSQVVIKNIYGTFSEAEIITSAGATATVSSTAFPTLNIIPYNSTGDSSLWTIVPATLTSITTATPVGGEQSTFTTNYTIEQLIYNESDDLVVTEVDPVLTIEQLYYPENVVQVDLSAGNYSIETLQSLFPSGVTGTQYVVLVQDFQSTSSLWSPVASIVIGTQFITVREEYSGTPITIGSGNLGSNASTGSFQKVLLETPIEVLPQESWRGLLYYEQKVDKMSSLGMSKEDLKNLDIQVYWRNRLTNSLSPLTLYNGGSANIRLLFKRIHE